MQAKRRRTRSASPGNRGQLVHAVRRRSTSAITTPTAIATELRSAVGVDLVSVSEVAASLERFGDRYVRRLFTAGEAAYCRAAGGGVTAARFAARFAAKEAVVKALQPELRWADWRAIEVQRHRSGRCAVILHGAAATLARRRGVAHLSLSMTHDGDHAAAIVMALCTSHRREPNR